MNDLARFEAKYEPEPMSGCWLWTGVTNPQGYGRFKIKGAMRNAHRVAYEMLIGPVPDGSELDHLCRTRSCVNPAHLEPVSHRTNVLRGTSPSAVNAVRTHCKNGHEFTEKNTYYRLTGGRTCRACNVRHAVAYKRNRRLCDG